MAEQRIQCWQCSAYDREARRCRLGKANPKTKHETLTVAELMGVRALCVHNPYREPLILRMRFPQRPFVWNDVVRRQPSPPMEIEIIEEEDGLE